MKDSHTAQRTMPLVGWALIGAAALESLYLLVYALAPIATVYPHVFPLGQVWPWTLALARLLFPGRDLRQRGHVSMDVTHGVPW